ncbi:MAG: hypothetical protein IT320_20630 [Anaerolineae bacterium]|nr:hypothetical protein [Anaerolineae bacterium]
MSTTKRLTLILFILLSLMAAVGVLAHGEEGDVTDDANVLTFYSHPTERYNVLIPRGWSNVVNSNHALLRNDAIGAQIIGTRVATSNPDEAVAQALGLAELPQDVPPVVSEAQGLTFGSWTQRLYSFDDGRTATAFVQGSGEQSYVILYVSADGVQPLIVRTEETVADEASARAALETALAALGYNDATIDSVSADSEANSSFNAALTLDGEVYNASLHRDSLTTADVLIAPGEAVDAAHEAVFTVVRDFFLTPDNGGYLILGLVVAFGLMALFLVTMVVRRRNLERDELALRQLEGTHDR